MASGSGSSVSSSQVNKSNAAFVVKRIPRRINALSNDKTNDICPPELRDKEGLISQLKSGLLVIPVFL